MSTAVLIQHKLFSSKRLMNGRKKIGKISMGNFSEMKEKLVELIP